MSLDASFWCLSTIFFLFFGCRPISCYGTERLPEEKWTFVGTFILFLYLPVTWLQRKMLIGWIEIPNGGNSDWSAGWASRCQTVRERWLCSDYSCTCWYLATAVATASSTRIKLCSKQTGQIKQRFSTTGTWNILESYKFKNFVLNKTSNICLISKVKLRIELKWKQNQHLFVFLSREAYIAETIP